MAAFVSELIAADNSPGYETLQGRAVTSGHTTASPEATGNAKPIPTAAPATSAAAAAPVPVPALKASSTTFSRSSGEVTAAVEKTRTIRRKHPVLWGGAVIGLVAGVTAAVMVGRGGSARRQPAPAPVVATPAPQPAPPAPVETPPPPTPPPAPAQVELRLASDPAGARVLRASDRSVLGATPLHLMVPRRDEALEVVIEKAGFKSQTIRVNLDRDVEQTVTLQKRAPRPVVVDPDESRKL
jgi:hypothetical protein